MFYAPDILNTHELPAEESVHCVKVLRKQAGDRITIVDGVGNFYQAEIATAHPKRCSVNILSCEIEEPSRQRGRLHIAVAPTKNMDRMEWFVEKATEIGIDEITLLRCRHSERKEVNTERLHKIMVSAMKQSLKATLPQLNDMTDLKTFLTTATSDLKTIAHCYKEDERTLLKEYAAKEGDILVLIGPEGDFDEEEVTLARTQGFLPVSLGNSRLRTETAALAACLTVQLMRM